jgi:hypothetical protein
LFLYADTALPGTFMHDLSITPAQSRTAAGVFRLSSANATHSVQRMVMIPCLPVYVMAIRPACTWICSTFSINTGAVCW